MNPLASDHTRRYAARGAAADKKEVHQALAHLPDNSGIIPNCFCKVLPDLLTQDPQYCIAQHADGAGTKTALAYLYWKETGDLSVWKGIMQDALVMNTDDLACAGFVDNFIVSTTIGRNKARIPSEVLTALILGMQQIIDDLHTLGFHIQNAGGETADLGDLVRTVVVDATVTARTLRTNILPINILPDAVVIGIGSYGRASYETEYNSGIGSNGLTAARHDLLHPQYRRLYPETIAPETPADLVYCGPHYITDPLPDTPLNIGQALLSPTRTFLPFIKEIFKQVPVQALIHNTGGGHTKVLRFLNQICVRKSNLLPIPPLFKQLATVTQAPPQTLFQIFNMGCRLEVYAEQKAADTILQIAHAFQLPAQIIGYCIPAPAPAVEIDYQGTVFMYQL